MTSRILSLIMFLGGSAAVAQETPRQGPERWESSITAFEQRDRASPPKPGALLFVGSSSIRMWDLNHSWPETATINNGFGGSTLADSIHFFDRLFARCEPRAVILYAGDNDVAQGLSAMEVSEDFKTLASKISASFPGVPIIYLAIKPSRARWDMWPTMSKANELIARQCASHDHWIFADIATPMLEDAEAAPDAKWFMGDGLHLSKWGYEQWTELVQQLLAESGIR